MLQTKWFYKAQKEANDQLYSLFTNCPCVYQLISKDRIAEVYQCSNPKDTDSDTGYPKDEWVLMNVCITKQGKSASVSIHQMDYKYGWKVN